LRPAGALITLRLNLHCPQHGMKGIALDERTLLRRVKGLGGQTGDLASSA